jgi:hypothetical protein
LIRRFVLAAPALGLAVAACSLGLDASLVNHGDAAPPGDDGGTAEGGTTDGAADGPVTPRAGACTTDADCKLTNACIKGARCDTSIHLCAYDVCTVATCQSSACDPMAKTCSVASSGMRVRQPLAACAK